MTESEPKVVLHGADRLYVSARVTPAGDVEIAGQDLRGSGEYEYWVTVASDDVPQLRTALGGAEGDDVLALLVARRAELVTRGERGWLTDHGIASRLWSHRD